MLWVSVGVCTRVCSTVHQPEGSFLYESVTIFFAFFTVNFTVNFYFGTGPGQVGPPGSFQVTLGTSHISLSL